MKKEIKQIESEKIMIKKIKTAMSLDETTELLNELVRVVKNLEENIKLLIENDVSIEESIDNLFDLCRIEAIRDTLCWVLGRGSLWILNKKIEDASNKNKKQGDLKNEKRRKN